MAEQNKVRQVLINRFLEALEQERLPWERGWVRQEAPRNPTTGNRYRGVNCLILSEIAQEKGYQDPRWCTYKQAKDRGWYVRKGETAAAWVEYWCCYDKIQKKIISWDEVKDLIKDNPAYDRNLSLRCRVSAVFNGEQIEGIPQRKKAPGIELGALRSKRDTLLQNMAVGFREDGDRAYYSPGKDTIFLPPEQSFYSNYDYMYTLLHEAGHATGHASRLNRHMTGGFGSPEYAREELRAEIASAFVAQELGLPGGQSHAQNHAAYIQSWISVLRKDPDELFRAISDAQSIADYLIEKGQLMELAPTLKDKEEVTMDKNFTKEQQEQIEFGRENGLTPDQVSIYAKPEFDENQMLVIREGLEDGLTSDQVRLFAKPEFDAYQMREIQHGLGDGLTEEQIKLYATPEFNADQMWEIRKGFGDGLTEEQIKLYARPEFMWRQMDEIKLGLMHGLAEKEASIYAKPEFAWLQMWQIRQGLEYNLTPEQVSIYAKPEFDVDQMRVIRQGLEGSMPEELVNLYAKPELSVKQMLEIREGLENGLTSDKVSIYAKHELDADQMEQIRFGLEDGLTPDQVSLFARHELDADQMRQIRFGLKGGLTPDQVSIYARHEFDAGQMGQIRFGLEDGLTPGQVSIYARHELDAGQMGQIRFGLEGGLTPDQVRLFAKPEFDEYQMKTIRQRLEQQVKQQPIQEQQEQQEEQMIETNMGRIPIADYRDIVAIQHGFDDAADMYRQGYRLGAELDPPEITAQAGNSEQSIESGFDNDLEPEWC